MLPKSLGKAWEVDPTIKSSLRIVIFNTFSAFLEKEVHRDTALFYLFFQKRKPFNQPLQTQVFL